MSDLSDQQSTPPAETTPAVDEPVERPRLLGPLSEAERAQIKFLLRTLVIVVGLVIVALTVAALLNAIIY